MEPHVDSTGMQPAMRWAQSSVSQMWEKGLTRSVAAQVREQEARQPSSGRPLPVPSVNGPSVGLTSELQRRNSRPYDPLSMVGSPISPKDFGSSGPWQSGDWGHSLPAVHPPMERCVEHHPAHTAELCQHRCTDWIVDLSRAEPRHPYSVPNRGWEAECSKHPVGCAPCSGLLEETIERYSEAPGGAMADAQTGNGGLSYMLPLPHGMLPAALPNGLQQTGLHISCLHNSYGNGVGTNVVHICS